MIIQPDDIIQRLNDRVVHNVVCFTVFSRPNDQVEFLKCDDPTQRRPQDNPVVEKPNEGYPDIKRLEDNAWVRRPQDSEPLMRE
jgi:hypothetical protein